MNKLIDTIDTIDNMDFALVARYISFYEDKESLDKYIDSQLSKRILELEEQGNEIINGVRCGLCKESELELSTLKDSLTKIREK